jgi:AraC-like DNA-binding protein
MLVYHGSHTLIEKIDLEKCRPYTDFGKGFYVTKYKHHAKNWAQKSGKRNNTNGYITIYNYLDGSFVDYICKKKTFNGYTEEWFDFIVKNRNVESVEQVHDFDIIEGPVANDKVQNRLEYYLSGKISKNDFLKELTYHEETHQICFCTIASLQALKYVDRELTVFIEQISEKILNNIIQDKKIDIDLASDIFYSSKTFADITNKKYEYYKLDWQQIYKMLQEELHSL